MGANMPASKGQPRLVFGRDCQSHGPLAGLLPTASLGPTPAALEGEPGHPFWHALARFRSRLSDMYRSRHWR